jgi:hypothetical protein
MVGTGWWLGYLSLLAPVVAFAAIRFDALYSPDSVATHPELSQQYRVFVGLSGMALAIALGVMAAAFGVLRASVVGGLLALVLGVATTVTALSVVPWVRFPEDQYAVAAVWLMGGLPALLVAFSAASLAFRLIARAGQLEGGAAA